VSGGPKRVLVIRQAHFPVDPRVRREVHALLGAGYVVDVFCTKGAGQPLRERQGRLHVYRLPLYHRRGGALGYVLEYLLFFVAAFAVASTLHLRHRYRLVQVHTLPDTLVFAALVPRLLGARVLLDLHECMPEFFLSKFGRTSAHPIFRLMAKLEQAAIGFADGCITCTKQMKEVFVERGARDEGIDVVLNSADESAFDPDRFPGTDTADECFSLLLHGAVEERYGHDTTLRAMALLADDLPRVTLDVYGDGSFLPAARRLADELGLGDRVRFSGGYVPLDELVAAIARADAGVVAMKRDPFRDLTQCNKMYDFVAMRKPVICSWTASAAAYFDPDSFAWFTSDDPVDMARAIRAVHDDTEFRRALVGHASRLGEPYRWERQRAVYLARVEALVGS
jgi:glycosyltransferase involved in cell wall biosynthesis